MLLLWCALLKRCVKVVMLSCVCSSFLIFCHLSTYLLRDNKFVFAEASPRYVAMADQFCLRWNNFQTNIVSALDSLKCSEDLVDVTLTCEGRNIKAHKVILSACSPYFRNVFKVNDLVWITFGLYQHLCIGYLLSICRSGLFNCLHREPRAAWAKTSTLKVIVDVSQVWEC